MAKKTESEETTVLNDYPAWFYGPGGEGQIFQTAEDVPEGWEDHPSKALPALDM